jgi:hypothetical protein
MHCPRQICLRGIAKVREDSLAVEGAALSDQQSCLADGAAPRHRPEGRG